MKVRKIVKPVLSRPKQITKTVVDKIENVKWLERSNALTKEFIKNRYVVLRNFIPKEILQITLDNWKTIEHNEKMFDSCMAQEEDITYNTPETQKWKSHGCHTFPPAVGLHRWLKDKLNETFELVLEETYNYSRKYVRGAILKAHTDRPSCEISTTICLDYKTDDNTPWKIWLNNEKNWIVEKDDQLSLYDKVQNVPRSERKKSISVSLEPGDVLVYQGPNVVHWRDTLVGDYSYHIFCHFVNYHSKMERIEGYIQNNMSQRYPVLQYDGRKNRYESSEKNQRGADWTQNVYMQIPSEELKQYVNNYDPLNPEEVNDSI